MPTDRVPIDGTPIAVAPTAPRPVTVAPPATHSTAAAPVATHPTTTHPTTGSTASNNSVNSYLANNFGLTAALVKMDTTTGKNLQWALNQINGDARHGPITDPQRAAELIAQTNWYRTYGANALKRMGQEATDPALFRQNLAQTTANIQALMGQEGIGVTPQQLQNAAKDAYLYGLDNNQVARLLVHSGGTATGGGSVGSQLDQIRQTALNNGVNLSPTELQTYSTNLMNGDKDAQYYNNALRQSAAAQYSVFSTQLHAGHDLSDLVKPYTDMASQLLETPVDMTALQHDPLFRDGKAFTSTGSDGQPAVKPLWQFRGDIMQDSRWQMTNNARDLYTNAGQTILKQFGLVS